jgi:hypothetical protein
MAGLLDAPLHSCDEAGLIFQHAGNSVFHQLLSVLAISRGHLLEPRFNVGREMYFHAFQDTEKSARGQWRCTFRRSSQVLPFLNGTKPSIAFGRGLFNGQHERHDRAMGLERRSEIQTLLCSRASVPFFGHPELRWFKIPTRKRLLVLYCGNLKIGDVANDRATLEKVFNRTRFIRESDARASLRQCCLPMIAPS